MTRLEAREVRLGYGDAVIIDGLTASIPDHRITSIIGANGCGKSTLLRGLARLLRPQGGAVLLDGQAIHHQPTKQIARKLGLLAQQANAPESITVEDLVRRGRYPHQSLLQPPTDADRDAIDRAIAFAGVDDLRDRAVDQLSGGQRQRAWLAMVLAQETDLLLLDEPTTFLDIAHQHEVLDLVRRLNRDEGKTVVMVLHDINEAARWSDHVIAMRDGAVVAEGTPAEMITPARILDVFNVATDVVTAPGTGLPICVPRGTPVELRAERPPTPVRLRADRLSLHYGARAVIDDLSVEVPAGAITAIVGPNACGKSTLLRGMSRLLPPAGGAALLDERPVHETPRRRMAQRMALLPQAPESPPGIRVDEMVASGRFPHQRWYRQWSAGDAAAVSRALDATDMQPLATHEVDALSGGQRQRAWVALTLAQDTPLLLLDEPTTFLDIAHQVELLDLVRALNRREGRTVVMVLHDLGQACRYADHVIVMDGGRVVAAGSPAATITEALVRDVFGVECDIVADPLTGGPLVIPHGLIAQDAAEGSAPPAEPARVSST